MSCALPNPRGCAAVMAPTAQDAAVHPDVVILRLVFDVFGLLYTQNSPLPPKKKPIV